MCQQKPLQTNGVEINRPFEKFPIPLPFGTGAYVARESEVYTEGYTMFSGNSASHDGGM